MDIEVFEFGGICSTGTTVDEYDVFLCTDTAAVLNNEDTSSCTIDLGGSSGQQTFTVTL
jgi:hypothetical protein